MEKDSKAMTRFWLTYQHKHRGKSRTQSNVYLLRRPTSFNTPQLLIKVGHWSIRTLTLPRAWNIPHMGRATCYVVIITTDIVTIL